MSSTSVAGLRNHEVLSRLAHIVAHDRRTTVEMLELIALADERRLYASTRFESMYDYLMGELHMSEDMAYTRIKVAELARKFPAVLPALAEGGVHLSGLRLLASYLTPENTAELLAAAWHRSKAEIARMLAARYPRPDVPTLIQGVPAGDTVVALVPERLDFRGNSVLDGVDAIPTTGVNPNTATGQAAATGVPVAAVSASPAPAPSALTPVPRTRITPLSEHHFNFQTTLDDEALELLKRARALLAHTMPGADPALVLKRVLGDWVAARERRKFGLTDRPRARKHAAKNRHIPNAIKREVVERDGKRCTFVDDRGRRCESRDLLEFDHVQPVARGGATTVSNLRLRCRTHNQLEADRVFGAGFMQERRAKASSPAAGG